MSRASASANPLPDRRFGERLDEEEDVGRPRARDRRQRVDLRLGHLDDAADGLEQPADERDLGGAGAGSGREARHRLADQRGRVRHRAQHGDVGAEDRLEGLRRDAGGEAHDDRARTQVRGDLAQEVGHHRGLDPDRARCRPTPRPRRCPPGCCSSAMLVTPVERGEFGGLGRRAVRRGDSAAGEAGAHQTVEDRTPHGAGAEDRDGREGRLVGRHAAILRIPMIAY